jgi:hypothetical protein
VLGLSIVRYVPPISLSADRGVACWTIALAMTKAMRSPLVCWSVSSNCWVLVRTYMVLGYEVVLAELFDCPAACKKYMCPGWRMQDVHSLRNCPE